MIFPGPVSTPLVDVAYLIVPALWIGMLVGVCFIATPAKFRAPTLSLKVALDVGRTTFATWNNAEWVLLALTMPLMFYSQDRFDSVLAFGAVGVLLLTQTMVLMPTLNERIVTIVAGGRPAASSDHTIYIAADILKIGILASIVWREGSRFISMQGVAY